MRKRNIVLTIAGAAAFCVGLGQLARRSTDDGALPVRQKSQHDVMRVQPETVVPLNLGLPPFDAEKWKRNWEEEREKQEKQDRERRFYEWRTA